MRRRTLGVSQEKLAEDLGLTFQQVQKYERGANRIAASTLLAAAQALKVSVGWLVGEDVSEADGDEELFRALARPGALEILEAFNLIPDARARVRRRLLDLVRVMGEEDADGSGE